MAQLWGGRFTKETDQLVYNFNASISFDKRFYEQDIRGSIAHVTMLAKQGILTPEMETVAKEEHLAPELIRERVAKGTICIPANINHKSLHPYGFGVGLGTKMNVILGISGDCHDYTAEFEKVKLAIQFQCEAIMDLSNYGKTHTFRKQQIEMSPAMLGTVPKYDAIG